MHRAFFSLSIIVGIASCAAEQDNVEDKYRQYVSEVISVADMLAESPDHTARVDMRGSTVGYLVTAGLEVSSVNLTCPNGQVMNLDAWLEAQSLATGIDVSASDSELMLISGVPGEPKLENGALNICARPPGYVCNYNCTLCCPPDCTLCNDGACLCGVE